METRELYEEAIAFVMEFYDQSREDIIAYYWDEVEAYLNVLEKECESS